MDAVLFLVILSLDYIVCAPESNRTGRAACNQYDFRCSNGRCIDALLMCDGRRDCSDGSDETRKVCGTQICPSFAFKCNYGACIDRLLVCDGRLDCLDDSDEDLELCSDNISDLDSNIGTATVPAANCGKESFSCISGDQCINMFLQCDGEINCNDGSDETAALCHSLRCPDFSFRCSYGACIEKNLKCDGMKNCHDGSDENNDECQNFSDATTHRVESSSTTTTVFVPETTKFTTPATTTTQRPLITTHPSNSNHEAECTLPEQIEGSWYKVLYCEGSRWTPACTGAPGTPAPPLTVLNNTCYPNHRKSNGRDTSQISICLNGQWSTVIEPCYRMCRPVISSSLDLECTYNGDPFNCSMPMPHESVVTRKCKDHYEPVDASSAVPKSECLHGDWSEPSFTCKPICGQRPMKSNAIALISNGQVTSAVEYPWHSSLYANDRFERFAYKCGGTILSQFLVLSAAHCVFDSYRKRNPNEIFVALGKTNRDWNIDDPGEVKLRVKDIYTKNDYRGGESNYEFDIAMLRVDLISFSSIILPICLDWMGKSETAPGTIGTVVGFGLTKAQSQESLSNVLRVARMPYMDKETCRMESPPGFKKLIGFDKFCARHVNGSGVQQGDSGGGYTIQNPVNHLYYIKGIVSIRERPKHDDDFGTFSVFTNIADHIDFIASVSKCAQLKHEDKNSSCSIKF